MWNLHNIAISVRSIIKFHCGPRERVFLRWLSRDAHLGATEIAKRANKVEARELEGLLRLSSKPLSVYPSQKPSTLSSSRTESTAFSFTVFQLAAIFLLSPAQLKRIRSFSHANPRRNTPKTPPCKVPCIQHIEA